MLCPNCGKEVTEGKKFCGYCGKPLHLVARADFDDEAPTRLESPAAPPKVEKSSPPSQPAIASLPIVPPPPTSAPQQKLPGWVWGMVAGFGLALLVIIYLVAQLPGSGLAALKPTETRTATSLPTQLPSPTSIPATRTAVPTKVPPTLTPSPTKIPSTKAPQPSPTVENWVVVFNKNYDRRYDKVVDGKLRLWWFSQSDWDWNAGYSYFGRDIRVTFDYKWVEFGKVHPKLQLRINDYSGNGSLPPGIEYEFYLDGWRMGLYNSDPKNSFGSFNYSDYSYGNKTTFSESMGEYENHVQIIRRGRSITLQIGKEIVNTFEYTTIDSSPQTALEFIIQPENRWYDRWILDIDNLVVEELH